MHVTEEYGFSVRLLQLAEDKIRITHLALAMYPCSGFPPFFCPISFVLKTQKGPHNSRASFQSWQYCYWNPEQFELPASAEVPVTLKQITRRHSWDIAWSFDIWLHFFPDFWARILVVFLFVWLSFGMCGGGVVVFVLWWLFVVVVVVFKSCEIPLIKLLKI